MTALVTDSGAGADANPIGGIWTTTSGYSAIRRVSNKIANSLGSDTDCGAYTSTVPPNDHYAQITIDTVGGGDCGPMIRIQTGAMSGYFVTGSSGTTMDSYIVNGGGFTIKDTDAGAYATSSVVYMGVVGTTFTTKLNGTPINSFTDATFASGRFGLNAYTAASRITNFEGGDFNVAYIGKDVRKFGPGISPDKLIVFTSRPLGFTAPQNVTLALTGQAVTVSAGSLTPYIERLGKSLQLGPGISPDYTKVFRARQLGITSQTTTTSVSLSGQAVTTSAGTLSPSNSLSVLGQAVSSSAGTLVPAISIALFGQSLTTSAGTLLPVLTVSLSGSAVTVSAGTLSAVVGQGAALTGQSSTASAGTIVATLSIALSGQAVTVSAGTLAPGGGDVLITTTPRHRRTIIGNARRETLSSTTRRILS